MYLDENIAQLIFDIEYEIGSECYNPNSYNGWTGEEGCAYRYPVKIYDDEFDGLAIHKGRIYDNCADNINTMKYTFGSNHLFIGNAIINVLNMLEDRYGIDFNELEDER